MLGTEPQLVADYVETGQVKLIFWPVLNHGNPSIYSTLTAECAGQQDPALFWALHEGLFRQQDGLWTADRDFYVRLAAGLGADQATFEACYDDPAALERVMELDTIRRQRGVFGQPTFDVNGRLLAGLASIDDFRTVLDATLE